MDMAPRIAIVGAGPSGLLLARLLLQRYNIRTTIFERDTDRHQKRQGGTLDLHDDGGLLAMREAGLWDEFQKYARYDGQDTILSDYHGNRVLEEVNSEEDQSGRPQRPEIDRIALRDILLDSLPNDIIQWNKRVTKVQKGKLQFEGGLEELFDLIVGADGAWSKVRPCLTTIQPFYAGITGIELRYGEVDKKHPEVARLVGRGGHMIFGEESGKAMILQRNGDGSVKCYAFVVRPEAWSKECGVDFNKPEEVREALTDIFGEWKSGQPDAVNAIKYSDDEMRLWPLYMLPHGLRWPSRSGLTVVGDAAHVMTPFAGEGVNAAMWDSMSLAKRIGESSWDLGKAVREYEAEMFEHAKEKTTETFENMLRVFDYGGVQALREMMTGGPPPQS